jgi:hypothetical protein
MFLEEPCKRVCFKGVQCCQRHFDLSIAIF